MVQRFESLKILREKVEESTNVAEVHHKHNGNYKALRFESKNPEARKADRGDACIRMAGGVVRIR